MTSTSGEFGGMSQSVLDAMDAFTLPSINNSKGGFEVIPVGQYEFQVLSVDDPQPNTRTRWDAKLGKEVRESIMWSAKVAYSVMGTDATVSRFITVLPPTFVDGNPVFDEQWLPAPGQIVPGEIYHTLPDGEGNVYARPLIVPDEGPTQLRLVAIDLAQPNQFNEKMDRHAFYFRVEDGSDFAGELIRAWYSPSLNEKSNLYPVAKALWGGELPKDREFSGRDYLNKMMGATIKHSDREKDKMGRVFAQIGGVYPLKPKRPRATGTGTTDDVPF